MRRAQFHDSSEVELARAVKSRSSETTFDADVEDAAVLEGVVRRLAGEVAGGLRRRGRRGRTIGIKVRLDDWTTVTRARTIEGFTDEAELVAEVAVELLRAYAPPRPVRLLGVRIAGFDDAEPEAGPARRGRPRRPGSSPSRCRVAACPTRSSTVAGCSTTRRARASRCCSSRA